MLNVSAISSHHNIFSLSVWLAIDDGVGLRFKYHTRLDWLYTGGAVYDENVPPHGDGPGGGTIHMRSKVWRFTIFGSSYFQNRHQASFSQFCNLVGDASYPDWGPVPALCISWRCGAVDVWDTNMLWARMMSYKKHRCFDWCQNYTKLQWIAVPELYTYMTSCQPWVAISQLGHSYAVTYPAANQ